MIKAYGREKHYEEQLHVLNNEYKKRSLNLTFVEAMFHPVMILMVGILLKAITKSSIINTWEPFLPIAPKFLTFKQRYLK